MPSGSTGSGSAMRLMNSPCAISFCAKDPWRNRTASRTASGDRQISPVKLDPQRLRIRPGDLDDGDDAPLLLVDDDVGVGRKRTQAGSDDELHALVEHPRLALGCAGCYLTARRAAAGSTARLRREPRQSAAWCTRLPASARGRAADAWSGLRIGLSGETR